jgi:hypothetical protein
MKKLLFMGKMMREILSLIVEHRLYFLAPVLITLVSLSMLVYYVGPTVVITFIYAGV